MSNRGAASRCSRVTLCGAGCLRACHVRWASCWLAGGWQDVGLHAHGRVPALSALHGGDLYQLRAAADDAPACAPHRPARPAPACRWCIEEQGFPMSKFAEGPLEFFIFSVTILASV